MNNNITGVQKIKQLFKQENYCMNEYLMRYVYHLTSVAGENGGSGQLDIGGSQVPTLWCPENGNSDVFIVQN